MVLLSESNYSDHFGWLETGSAKDHRYIDIQAGIEDVIRAEAQQYNQSRGRIVITNVSDMANLPEDFRDQFSKRLIETFGIEIDAYNIARTKTLENLADVIFQMHERYLVPTR